MPEKGTFLLAAIESGCSVFKCEGCGAVAIGKPGAGDVGPCPDCETRALNCADCSHSLLVANSELKLSGSSPLSRLPCFEFGTTQPGASTPKPGGGSARSGSSGPHQ